MRQPHKRYPELSLEEEANLRGVPVPVIDMERRMNEELNEPSFLDKINQELGPQESVVADNARPEPDPRPWSRQPSRIPNRKDER